MNSIEQNILQKKLAKFIVSDVFNTITEEDLIITSQDKKKWFYKGNELTLGQIKVLKQEASSLLGSNLWKILRSELIWNAQNKVLNKGETEADLVSGKVLRYLVEVLDKRLAEIVA